MLDNFVKTIHNDVEGLLYLKNKFSGINEATAKEGIFVQPQNKESMKDASFDNMLDTWLSFKTGIINCKQLIDEKNLEVNILLKINFLQTILLVSVTKISTKLNSAIKENGTKACLRTTSEALRGMN